MIVERDWEILRTLAFKIRVMSLHQMASVFWAASSPENREQVAENSLARLCKMNLLLRHRLLAYSLPEILSPIVSWSPGEPPPDFHAVEWKLTSRWPEKPVYTPTYEIGKRALNYFAAPRPKPLSLGQETHDLGQAQVYIAYLEKSPEAAKDWRGEESYRDSREGEKLPDAMLFRNGTPYRVVDFGGRYDYRRVMAFHRDCANRNLPYEIW